MNKLIITRWKERLLTMTIQDGKAVQLDLEDHGASILGNIYIGKVKNIIKNINAAFLDIGNGQIGYFNLTGAIIHHADSHKDNRIKPGDELIVQVERDSVKTKAPVVTGNLNFSGRYCVVTAGKNQIGFSNKLTDMAWKREVKVRLEEEKDGDFGIIVRTNAGSAPKEALFEELSQIKATYYRIMEQAAHRVCYSLLYEAVPPYLSGIRDSFSDSLEAIVTDDTSVFEAMRRYLTEHQPHKLGTLSLYEDRLLPLAKLYQAEKIMEESLATRVWLKSGGYLVIEPTEALTVIDVNTGKYAGKKNPHETIMKINLEAAAEIGRQIRLRNLSGIIVVDFIDMESPEDQKLLSNTMSVILSRDPVKSTVVEITKLYLMEITRKKIRRPLYEQVQQPC